MSIQQHADGFKWLRNRKQKMAKLLVEVTKGKLQTFEELSVSVEVVGEKLKLDEIQDILIHALAALICGENGKVKK